MTSPEDLIGEKSKERNGNNDMATDKQSCSIRYASENLLAEAVLIAGQPKFLITKRNCASVSIQSSISVDGRILRPLGRAGYLSMPYSFSSEQEISKYENEAKSKTLSDLYTQIKSMSQLFIVGDKQKYLQLGAAKMRLDLADCIDFENTLQSRVEELNLKLKDCNNLRESDILINEIDTLESILGRLSDLKYGDKVRAIEIAEANYDFRRALRLRKQINKIQDLESEISAQIQN